LSNGRRRQNLPSAADGDDSDEESARLLQLQCDDVWKPISGSATLGKQPRVSGNQGVMPNPDDILPKQAWTDFSGTDDWPNLLAGRKASNPDENDAYVNVAAKPPKPKERKLLNRAAVAELDADAEVTPERDSAAEVKDMIYESLVDDLDHDDASSAHGRGDLESGLDRCKPVSQSDSAEDVSAAPAVFRSTKFITVSPVKHSLAEAAEDR
jgi:hypothetical protein